MSIKEQVINESIDRINHRIQEIDDMLEANPLTEICQLRITFKRLLDNNKTLEERTSPDFVKTIKILAAKEKELFKIAKKQQEQDSCKLIKEKVKLEMELSDLNHELYFLQRITR